MKNLFGISEREIVRSIVRNSGQPLALIVNKILSAKKCGIILDIANSEAYILGEYNASMALMVQILSLIRLLTTQGYLYTVEITDMNVVVSGLGNGISAARRNNGYDLESGIITFNGSEANVSLNATDGYTTACHICPRSIYADLRRCFGSECYATASLLQLVKDGFETEATHKYKVQRNISWIAVIIAVLAFVATLFCGPIVTVNYQNKHGVTRIVNSQMDSIWEAVKVGTLPSIIPSEQGPGNNTAEEKTIN